MMFFQLTIDANDPPALARKLWDGEREGSANDDRGVSAAARTPAESG
jgi:hypothetical protein